LKRTGYYISTWQASDSRGQPVAVRFLGLVTHEDMPPGFPHFLRPRLDEWLPDFYRLWQAKAAGLAPWLSLHQPEEPPAVILARSWYPERLMDHFAAQDLASPPPAALLAALRDIVPALEYYEEFAGARGLVAKAIPTNLLMREGHAFLADCGTEPLERMIEQSYEGPRIVDDMGAMSCYASAEGVDARFALASLYYSARTRAGLFSGLPSDGGPDFALTHRNRMQYAENGPGPLLNLPDEREREVVARALAREPRERFESAAVFLDHLSRL
jgi:hypothetical protein